MTYRERLKLEYPECVSDKFEGGCEACPDYHGYEEYTSCCPNCEYCWNRECDK